MGLLYISHPNNEDCRNYSDNKAYDKKMFAQSAMWEAVSSDGHIRLPPWFPLGAIVLVIISGIVGLFAIIRAIGQRR